MGLVSTKQYPNGAVVAMFNLVNDYEVNAYKSRLELDMPKCPECGEDLHPNRADMLIRVDNPMTTFLGYNAGTMVTTCQHCHKTIEINSSILVLDEAFPSIVEILKKSREQQNQAAGIAATTRMQTKPVPQQRPNVQRAQAVPTQKPGPVAPPQPVAPGRTPSKSVPRRRPGTTNGGGSPYGI